MELLTYINHHYGEERGNKAAFLRDNPHILPQELSRWLKAGLQVRAETGEIYKPTSKAINTKNIPLVNENVIAAETMAKLRSRAGEVDMSDDAYLNYLIDDEAERNYFVSALSEQGTAKTDTPVQLITSLVNDHLADLSPMSELYEYQAAIESLYHALVNRKLLNVVVPDHLVAESERLAISRTAYYWHGSVIADRTAKMLGSYEVYLWHQLYHHTSEVVFIGAPNNIVACYFICDRLCKLLQKRKTAYKKEQGGWGSKKDIEDSANQFVYQFSQGIFSRELGFHDYESDLRLIRYADEKYSYAMDH